MTSAVRSRPKPASRLSNGYIAIWALLAAMALGYLALLSLRPEIAEGLINGPPAGQPEGNRGQRALALALAEINALKATIGRLEQQVGDLRTLAEAREAKAEAMAAGLTALQARLDAGLPAVTATRPALPKASDDTPATAVPSKAARAAAATPPAPAAPVAPVVATTGSLPERVTPHAVLLGSGPTLDALHLTWQLLQDSHKSALRGLQPRFTGSEAEPGSFRLFAGPLATAADAQRLCQKLKARRVPCTIGAFDGRPL